MPDWEVGISWEDYEVSGENLDEVSAELFNGERHAGRTIFKYRFSTGLVGFDGCRSNRTGTMRLLIRIPIRMEPTMGKRKEQC